ncbi:MAG: LysR family transcriptional regulator [Polaromonas sp.]
MSRQFSGLMLGSIEVFCLAAELQSFAAAAAAAGLTPAAVSRTIARLEARLGVRLFARTTRQVRLTEGGQAYFDKCLRALGELVDAERELAGKQIEPSGTLRMSLPTPYGHHRVLPLLPRFRARYPGVLVDVNLSNRNIDFTAEGFDLAIRGRTPPDSGLVARKLEDAALVVVAAPGYLARAGAPQSPNELSRHDCLQFVLPSTGQRVPWVFRQAGADIEMQTEGGYSCSEDVAGGVTLARHGAGLLQIYRFMVEDDLQSGTLQEVLQAFAGRSRPFSILYPANRYLPLRVRVFINFLVENLGNGSVAGVPELL